MYVSCTVHHLPSGVKYKSDFNEMSDSEAKRFINLLKNVDELAYLKMLVRSNFVYIPPNILKESVFTVKKHKWSWIAKLNNVF